MNRDDLKLDAPVSLKEIVRDELIADQKGEEVKPITDETIDTLMKKVYAHIERQALEVYHSNEPWALKYWAYANILKDTIAEQDEALLEGLIAPVIDWQNQSFDPIAHYQKRLQRKSYWTQKAYMQAASRFVAREGRKGVYTDDDLDDYQIYAGERFKNENTYYQEMQKVLLFVRNLPGADKNRELPMGLPDKPKKFNIPTATLDDLETLIWACVIDNIDTNMVVRLACATIYGRRLGELTEFKVQLDGVNSDNNWIVFSTEKGGEESPHPIPSSLVPLFAVPISPMSRQKIRRKLIKVCRRAGIDLPPRAGYHWIRRRVATTVKKVCGSEIDTHRFMRWAPPRQFSMLARYDQTPHEETDKDILQKHPVVKIWQQALPHLMYCNSGYEAVYCNSNYLSIA